jgi:hypothetical protein
MAAQSEDHPSIGLAEEAVVSLPGPDEDPIEFWRDKTPEQRIRGLELIRRQTYGEAACTARVERVLEITTLSAIGDE